LGREEGGSDGRFQLWGAGLGAGAAFAGLVLAVNFVLANRMGFSPVAADSFDEGISLDSLLVGIQLVLLGVALMSLAPLWAREAHAGGRADARHQVRSPTRQATPGPPSPHQPFRFFPPHS